MVINLLQLAELAVELKTHCLELFVNDGLDTFVHVLRCLEVPSVDVIVNRLLILL